MRAKLRVLEGSDKTLEVPLKTSKFFIGRDKTCHLRPRSDLISRHHCVILIEADRIRVRDFGSKNGTLVNGQRVDGEQELFAGDVLGVGPLKFSVIIEQPAKVAPRTPATTPSAPHPDDSTHSVEDIDSWLQEPEPNTNKSIGDTQLMRAKDSASETKINKGSSSDKPDSESGSRSSHPTPPPLSKAAIPSRNANSQDAAAHVLRQLNQHMREKRDADDSRS